MSKKFIFAKTASDFSLRQEVAFNHFSAISNVYQLSQVKDLHPVLLKDLALLNSLTSDLAASNPHGWLWSGEAWPLLERLYLSPFVDWLYFFYRTGDRLPPFFAQRAEQAGRTWQIFNWHIVRLPSAWFLKKRMAFLRAQARSEVELRRLWQDSAEEFKKTPSLGKSRIKARPTVLFTAPDGEEHALWQLLNTRIKPLATTVYWQGLLPIGFANGWLFGGVSLRLLLDDPLLSLDQEIRGQIQGMELSALNRMISDTLSDIQRLLLTIPQGQVDLFFATLEKSFMEYWQEVKGELTTAVADAAQAKTLAVFRFMLLQVKQKYPPSCYYVLKSAMLRALRQYASKKNAHLTELLQHWLRVFYSDIYAVSLWRETAGDPLSLRENDPAEQPLWIVNTQEWKAPQAPLWRFFVEKEANSTTQPRDVTQWGEDDLLWKEMSPSLRSLLTRLLSEKKEKIARAIGEIWYNVHSFIKEQNSRENKAVIIPLGAVKRVYDPVDQEHLITVLGSLFAHETLDDVQIASEKQALLWYH